MYVENNQNTNNNADIPDLIKEYSSQRARYRIILAYSHIHNNAERKAERCDPLILTIEHNSNILFPSVPLDWLNPNSLVVLDPNLDNSWGQS